MRKLIVSVCCMLALVGCGNAGAKSPENNKAYEEPEIAFVSEVKPDECVLCGDRDEFLLPLYKGQKNIGIVDLNTFDLSNIGINRYDDNGNLIEEKAGYSSTQTTNYGEDGMMLSIHTNTDRGYASVDLSFPEDNELDTEAIEKLLCSECFNAIYEETWSGKPYSIGVIDFETMEVRLFEENLMGFSLGDYYVDIEYRDVEQGQVGVDAVVFYCPVRY